MIRENRQRLQDPEFAHARSYLEEAVAEGEDVVEFFLKERRKNGGA